MGPERVENGHSSLLSRACRFPRKVVSRVNDLSDTIYREHIRPLRLRNNIPYKFLALAIPLLIYLPSMMMFTPVIPRHAEFTSGNEVHNRTYCNIDHLPEAGVTHAVLLNNTPFDPMNDWRVTPGSYDYDFNRYVRKESDGYHVECPPVGITSVRFSRTMQIPLFNCSDVSIAVEIEGVSGSAGIYLEAFADEDWAMAEAAVTAGQIVQVNTSAPLMEARQRTSCWLGTVSFRFEIASDVEAQIIVRRVVVQATFTTKLSRVQIDIQSTENVSLYENSYVRHLGIAPRITIIRNGDSDSAAVYTPVRADDELHLAPGIYEGMVFWPVYDSEYLNYMSPDPTNATSWMPDVNFTILEDDALEIDVRVFTIRVDIDLSPHILISELSMRFRGAYLWGSTFDSIVVGSTLYPGIPDYVFIPSGVGRVIVRMLTWTADTPYFSWYALRVYAETSLDVGNCSRNLKLSVVFPYVTIGAAVLGLGDFVLLAIAGLLLIGSATSLHRVLRHSNLRHRLSDSKLLPIVLLGAGIFLPWSSQLSVSQSLSYASVYRISWFSMPFMVLWSDSTAVQVFCATRDWWYASILSTFLLFVPMFYAVLSLQSPETEGFDRRFALALFLPYLVVLSGFNFSVLSLDTISIGPILTIAALPVWLMRIALRRLAITK